MLKLGTSPIFKQEYDIFISKIDSIEDPKFRDELNTLLSKLVSEVRNIDQLHGELSVTNRLPLGAKDSRQSIIGIRRLLVNKLRDYEEFLKQTNQL